MSDMRVVPNSFQTPNAHVDQAMAFLSGEEYKVLSFVTRHIYGWQDSIVEREKAISVTMIERGFTTSTGKNFGGVGLARTTITAVLKALESFGFITKVGNPTAKGQVWQMGEQPDWAALFARHTAKKEAAQRKTAVARNNKKAQKDAGQRSVTQTSKKDEGQSVAQTNGRSVTQTSSQSVPQTSDQSVAQTRAGLSHRLNQTNIQTHSETHLETHKTNPPLETGGGGEGILEPEKEKDSFMAKDQKPEKEKDAEPAMTDTAKLLRSQGLQDTVARAYGWIDEGEALGLVEQARQKALRGELRTNKVAYIVGGLKKIEERERAEYARSVAHGLFDGSFEAYVRDMADAAKVAVTVANPATNGNGLNHEWPEDDIFEAGIEYGEMEF